MRICACVGTHATGKTTSSYMIAQSFKMQKMNAIAVAESVREAPVGFNKGHTADTTEWVASHQKCKEITCKAQGYEMMVTDRSILDSLVYHRALKLPMDEAYLALQSWAYQRFRSCYELVIFIRCGDTKLIADGVRDEDQEFRKAVDAEFASMIKESGIDPKKVVEIQFSDLIDKSIHVDASSLAVTLHPLPDRS